MIIQYLSLYHYHYNIYRLWLIDVDWYEIVIRNKRVIIERYGITGCMTESIIEWCIVYCVILGLGW